MLILFITIWQGINHFRFLYLFLFGKTAALGNTLTVLRMRIILKLINLLLLIKLSQAETLNSASTCEAHSFQPPVVFQKMAQTHPETVKLQKNNSSAVVHLFGATLTSWKPSGIEALFVSKKSFFDNQKPIRGGVPVVFPQFGPWQYGPQHGFARRMKWSIKERAGDSVSDTVTLVLEDSDDTRKLWNYKFRFEYILTLISDEELRMEALITNTGEKEFDFTFLLHTYFGVSDVKDCAVIGLKGCSYIDKIKNKPDCLEENEVLKLSEATDRVYKKTASTIKLKPVSNDREMTIEKTNLPDTVVWNPWEEGAKKMEDFGDDEWKSMICVEAGYVNSPYILKPKESFRASQVLRVSKL